MGLDACLAGTDTLTALDDAYDAAWGATDADLLRICRDRMAMLRRDGATLAALSDVELDELRRWPTSERYGPVERAALDFTEQYLIDVASVSDDQVAALRAHLGDQGVVDFVNALLVVEQRMSLELFFERVL